MKDNIEKVKEKIINYEKFKIPIINTLEEYLGNAIIFLYKDHFEIRFDDLNIKRYYSLYSKLYHISKHSKYFRFQIDEYNFMNIIPTIKFINSFSKYYSYSLKNNFYHHSFYKIKILNSDNILMGIEGLIYLYTDCFLLKTNLGQLYCEYLPRSRPRRIIDSNKSILWIDLGNGFGLVKCLFQNEIIAEECRIAFLNNYSSWVGLSINSRCFATKINLISQDFSKNNKNFKHQLNIFQNPNMKNKKKQKMKQKILKNGRNGIIKIDYKLILSNKRLVLFSNHFESSDFASSLVTNSNKPLIIQTFMRRNIKILNYDLNSTNIQLQLLENHKNKIVLEFKNKKQKKKFFLNLKQIKLSKIIKLPKNDHFKKFGSIHYCFKIYFLHPTKLIRNSKQGILKLFEFGLILMNENSEPIYSTLNQIKIKTIPIKNNCLMISFSHNDKHNHNDNIDGDGDSDDNRDVNMDNENKQNNFFFGFSNPRHRQVFLWRFLSFQKNICKPNDNHYSLEFPTFVLPLKKFPKFESNINEKKVPAVIMMSRLSFQIIQPNLSKKISYSSVRIKPAKNFQNRVIKIYQNNNNIYKFRFVDQEYALEWLKIACFMIELNYLRIQDKKRKRKKFLKNGNYNLDNNSNDKDGDGNGNGNGKGRNNINGESKEQHRFNDSNNNNLDINSETDLYSDSDSESNIILEKKIDPNYNSKYHLKNLNKSNHYTETISESSTSRVRSMIRTRTPTYTRTRTISRTKTGDNGLTETLLSSASNLYSLYSISSEREKNNNISKQQNPRLLRKKKINAKKIPIKETQRQFKIIYLDDMFNFSADGWIKLSVNGLNFFLYNCPNKKRIHHVKYINAWRDKRTFNDKTVLYITIGENQFIYIQFKNNIRVNDFINYINNSRAFLLKRQSKILQERNDFILNFKKLKK
ncbi:hypothetical protein M0813_09249 [Anaeramoeba flamelloides]|uniref:PH domain-containing protein n=1 Tax=Anaeramoeba flamelloides TaxID=1746091 RepID=A0ABQ8X5Z6_9EUKA|nr:hypothetical protein M0813_09249 [Anaeramoeba flamelloides]